MKKEGKKTKPNRRTALTAWASRTERCSVAQLPRRTKHIPRRQKVRSKGGAPSDQRAGTQKRLRNIVEEENPNAKTQREEDDKEARRNFFSRETSRQ